MVHIFLWVFAHLIYMVFLDMYTCGSCSGLWPTVIAWVWKTCMGGCKHLMMMLLNIWIRTFTDYPTGICEKKIILLPSLSFMKETLRFFYIVFTVDGQVKIKISTPHPDVITHILCKHSFFCLFFFLLLETM